MFTLIKMLQKFGVFNPKDIIKKSSGVMEGYKAKGFCILGFLYGIAGILSCLFPDVANAMDFHVSFNESVTWIIGAGYAFGYAHKKDKGNKTLENIVDIMGGDSNKAKEILTKISDMEGK